jgi:hypothetical protein
MAEPFTGRGLSRQWGVWRKEQAANGVDVETSVTRGPESALLVSAE